jgi:nicotinate-nucleotide adenylyltransferase
LKSVSDRAGAVAVFGGTFNPIHFGHLRSALELLEQLPLAQLRFMPAQQPPHRDMPEVSAADRAAMVELAIAGEPRFCCDRRELQREGPSYTVDSLMSLRAELGAKRPLGLVMGCDALLGLPSWHRWEEIPELAHIVVLGRPGWSLPADGTVGALLRERSGDCSSLESQPAGSVITQTLRPQDISATNIRALLQSGLSARYLLPDSVLDYIAEHGLYGTQE